MSDETRSIIRRFKDVEQTPFSRNLTALDSQQMDMLIAPNESASDLLPDRARIVINALDKLDLGGDEKKIKARQAAYSELSNAKAYSVREKLAGVTVLDVHLQEKLAQDDHYIVRRAVAANTNFDLEIRLSLIDDPVEAVRAAAPSAIKPDDSEGGIDRDVETEASDTPDTPKTNRMSDNGITLH